MSDWNDPAQRERAIAEKWREAEDEIDRLRKRFEELERERDEARRRLCRHEWVGGRPHRYCDRCGVRFNDWIDGEASGDE